MLFSIPSPPQGVWYLGPLPLRAYGWLIALGMIVAVIITRKRYAARGGDPELVFDVAMWAIPIGIIGARLYHVTTSWQGYFGAHGNPWDVMKIWEGGIGIWGGVAFGFLGGWIALKRRGMRIGPFVDSIAPALLIAQAIGRLGNWFNQELFGAPTTLPWGLEIDAAHTPAGYAIGTLFHPTFLYELLWNLTMAIILILLDRRVRFAGGQVMLCYIMMYTAGRVWIEMLRIDTANTLFGLRVNVVIMAATFIAALIGFILVGRRGASTRVLPEENLAMVAADAHEGEDGVAQRQGDAAESHEIEKSQ